MKSVRIIERTFPDGTQRYTIQQKHFLFFWLWVDAWINEGVECTDTFSTLEEAQKNLCWFDGTKIIEYVVDEVYIHNNKPFFQFNVRKLFPISYYRCNIKGHEFNAFIFYVDILIYVIPLCIIFSIWFLNTLK